MERKRIIPLQFWRIIMCVLCVLGWCNGGTVKKVMSVGDNATFDCYPPRFSSDHVTWSSRNPPNPTELIATINLVDGVDQLYPNFQIDRYASNFVQAWTEQESKFTISIRNLTVEDSSNYVCEMLFLTGQSPEKLLEYEITVIGCECNLDDAGPDQSLSCDVDGYQTTSRTPFTTIVTVNETVTEREGILQLNTLSIPVQPGEISRITSIEFNPLSVQSFQSLVSCALPLLANTTPDVSTGLMSSSPRPKIPEANGTVYPGSSLTTNNALMCTCSHTLAIVSSVLVTTLLVLVVELFVLFLYRRTRRCRATSHAEGSPDEGKKGTAAVEVNEVYYSSVKQPDADMISHEYATFIKKTKAESEL